MAKQVTPKPKKIAVKDVKERISRAESYTGHALKKAHTYEHNAQFEKTPKGRAKLDSLSKANFRGAESAMKVSDQYKSILSAGMAKKAKASAVVEKKVKATLFKLPKPVKPTVLKKK